MRPARNVLLLRRTCQMLFLLLAGNLLFVPDCAAQLSAADLLTTPRFSVFEQFALSPDNSSVAYTVERTEWPVQGTGDPGNSVAGKFRKTSELWISDLQTRSEERRVGKECRY